MKRVFSIFSVLVLAIVILFAHTPGVQAGSTLSASQVNTYKQAKAAGRLLEQSNGYLRPGSGASGSLVALMKEVNRLRKEKYMAIARKNSVPLQAVELSAGKKLSGR